MAAYFNCPDGASKVNQCFEVQGLPPLTVDWSLSGVSQDETMLIFGGGMFLWAVGLGIGLLISVIRRTRL